MYSQSTGWMFLLTLILALAYLPFCFSSIPNDYLLMEFVACTVTSINWNSLSWGQNHFYQAVLSFIRVLASGKGKGVLKNLFLLLKDDLRRRHRNGKKWRIFASKFLRMNLGVNWKKWFFCLIVIKNIIKLTIQTDKKNFSQYKLSTLK